MDDELFTALVAIGVAAVLLVAIGISVVINEPNCPQGSRKELVRSSWYCTVDPVKS
jgi:hypothetical protein